MNSATATHDELTLIGAAVGLGASDPGCVDGPQALLDGGLPQRLRQTGLKAHWLKIFAAPPPTRDSDPVARIAVLDAALAAETERLSRARALFVALGGDHSAAIGLWSGAARSVKPRPFGLIWIDAHMDSHTFATTPSRMIHGMPVACLLGHGDRRLTGLAGAGPAVAPEHLCLIGTRSWEDGEAALLERLKVRIIKMPEVDSRGFDAALQDALAIATNGTARFGISLDIDAFDPDEITGTGLHVPDGLRQDEVLPALRRLRRHDTLAGLEIAEYNPHHDHNGKTAKLIDDMIAATFGRA